MGNVEAYSFQIASQLMETADYSDRCVHTLTRSDDPEVIPTVVLDWQRTFKVGRPLRKKALAEVLATGEGDALLYFEKIAEGSNFDV